MYVIHDTQMRKGQSFSSVSPDDYIFAVLCVHVFTLDFHNVLMDLF